MFPIIAWPRLCLLQVALLLMPTGLAAEPGVLDEQTPVRVFTPRDGLPNEFVYGVAQSADGRIWAGTAGGLVFFDGHTFRSESVPERLVSALISRLLVTEDGSMWVISSVGTWRLNATGTWQEIDALREVRPRAILLRDDSPVFFGLNTAVVGLPDAQPLPYDYPIFTPSTARISEVGSGSGPAGAVATGSDIVLLDRLLGPVRFDPIGGSEFRSENRGEWAAIASDSRGGVWAVETTRGLVRVDADLSAEVVMPLHHGTSVAVFNDIVHVTASTGLHRYDVRNATALEPLSPNLGVPSQAATVSFVDHEGSIWIGTRSHLVQLPRPNVRHLVGLDGGMLMTIRFSAPAAGEEVWATSYMRGLLRVTPDPMLVQPLEARDWAKLALNDQGELFALGGSGLARNVGEQWHLVRPLPGAVRGHVANESTAFVWKDHGAYLYETDPGAGRALLTWPVDERDYHAIATHPDGGLVIRSYSNLLHMRPDRRAGSFATDTLAVIEEMHRWPGRYMVVDASGTVWVDLGTRGVIRAEGGQVTQLLEGESVRMINLVDGDRVLVSTRAGLYGLDRRTGEVEFALKQGDGLLANTTTGALIHNDMLLVAHPAGISKLPLEDVLAATRSHPKVVFLSTNVGHPDEPPVPAKHPTFRFFATSYINPEALTYQYRIGEGEWLPADGQTLQLHGLSGGRHTVAVRTVMPGGGLGPATQQAFIVPTPWHRAWWFRMVVAGGMLALFGVVIRARAIAASRREDALRKLVDQRTRRLSESMGLIEAQARQIRAHDELKTRFFANTSHEFRTPLTVMRAVVQDLRSGRHGSLSEEALHKLAVVEENADRLTELVRELLDLARLDEGRMTLTLEPGDLVAHLGRLVDAHAPAAESRQTTLSYEPQVETYPTLFDGAAVDKIVSNLLCNAIKHGPEGGEIRVSLAEDLMARTAEMRIEDRGGGIAEELLPHLFDRFSTTNGARGDSSGLGLAVVREFAELLGGTVSVESKLGVGSVFIVRLPLERRPEGHAFASGDGAIGLEAPPVRPAEVPLRDAPERPRVLVVEDNPYVRSHLVEHLAESYEVFETGDGRQAWEIAVEIQPDLVVSDVMMPGIDGEELCRRIRQSEPLGDTPVLLVTARAGDANTVAGLRAGADGYIEKPFDIDVLKATAARLISSRDALRNRWGSVVTIEALDLKIESSEEAFLRRVIDIVEEHLSETNLSVDAVADQVGLSPRQLRRRVREATGLTPVEFIRRYRLERAARMLRAEAATVAEIANEVGYARPTTFTAHFKARYGCTPSEYVSTAGGTD